FELSASMERVLAATHKGLFILSRATRGWERARVAFLGCPVTMVLSDERDGAIYVALRLRHFGVHLHRSLDGGQTWQELPAPAYPENASDEQDGLGRPWPWTLDRIWALETGGMREPGVLWCGTVPGGLFRSDDRGNTWQLQRSLWNEPRRKR